MYIAEGDVLRLAKKLITNESPKLLEIVQQSYKEYLTNTYCNDVKYLADKLSNILSKPVEIIKCYIDKLEGDDLVTELSIRRSKYYPVKAIFNINNSKHLN